MKLEIEQLSKRFTGNQYPAVDNITFSMQAHEILAFVGPSGCGKTTTLRLIAGLERPDQGTIHLDQHIISDTRTFVPPEKRNIGMVFQDHALFPHLSVFDNIAFGLRGYTKKVKKDRVLELLKLVDVEALSKRFPHILSGGERQRVALARALAPKPTLLLMDEPFSSLDAHLRLEVREHIRNILKASQSTVIFVTHDQEEALYMGDRLAVFNQGKLEQIGFPEIIFHNSGSRFVAAFMGDSDFVRGKSIPTGYQTELGILKQQNDYSPGTDIEIAVRADDIDFKLNKHGNGRIINRFFRGAFNFYRIELDSGAIVHVFKLHTEIYQPGERVLTYFNAGHPLKIFAR
ncbi:MAG: ABC transporter ATP-binding protein [Chloroflexi bacterium HGW-Chloroflexi-3]|nr:MAG: ABC transporter ATP-binding protein [Chloroflexi bacterium HGW-Chloroflexi-3]